MDKKKLLEVVNQWLKFGSMEIDSIELDEIINIYDHYLDLLLEITGASKNSYHDRYGFINNSTDWDIEYKNIFVDIIIIKRNNLLYCLDYLRLINSIRGPIYNIVKILSDFTLSLLSYHHGHKDKMDTVNNRINYFYNNNENIITTWLDDQIVNCIYESMYIPNDYKEVIQLYKNLNNIKCSEKYKISIKRIINISYYYFMTNNYFNTECDSVIKFLEDIYNNPTSLLDQINMSGITYRDDLINYLDYLYQDSKSNKNKVIK